MEFNKIDLSKMFDVTTAIDTVEKTVKSTTTYLPEQVRASVQSINDASFNLARDTAQSFTEFLEVLQSVAKDSTAEATKAVKKAAKVDA
jgi:negative regulator of replication initiation